MFADSLRRLMPARAELAAAADVRQYKALPSSSQYLPMLPRIMRQFGNAETAVGIDSASACRARRFCRRGNKNALAVSRSRPKLPAAR